MKNKKSNKKPTVKKSTVGKKTTSTVKPKTKGKQAPSRSSSPAIVSNDKKGKNVSKRIKNGTVLQTRDEYLHGQGNYRKKGYEKKGNYRKVAVIDSNRRDELAVVKLYSTSGTTLIETNSRYKPFVETLDNENKRIRVGGKFIPNGQKLSKQNVSIIKKDCFKTPNVQGKNTQKVREIKGRRVKK